MDPFLTLLEKRVSRLERILARDPLPQSTAILRTESINYTPDDPRIIFIGAYEVERDQTGKYFRWFGQTESAQIVLPHDCVCPQQVTLIAKSYAGVPLKSLRIASEGGVISPDISMRSDDIQQIQFIIPPSQYGSTELLLNGIEAISPALVEGSNDNRRLSFRVYQIQFTAVRTESRSAAFR